jgi:hypothetical protein
MKYFSITHILILVGFLNINLLYSQEDICGEDYFFGRTNDNLYWNNKIYYLGNSPLSIFTDYEYIYPQFWYSFCHVTYEGLIDEKHYIVRWAIVNDSLYLCSTTGNCDLGYSEDMLDYYRYMSDPFRIDRYLEERAYNKKYLKNEESIKYLYTKNFSNLFSYNKNVMNPPLEKLTGIKFRSSPYFPYSIINIPMTSDGVIPAVWFSGILDIKNLYADIFSSYQRLTFRKGKVISIQKVIPTE